MVCENNKVIDFYFIAIYMLLTIEKLKKNKNTHTQINLLVSFISKLIFRFSCEVLPSQLFCLFDCLVNFFRLS